MSGTTLQSDGTGFFGRLLQRFLQHSQIYNFLHWSSRRRAPESGTIFLSQRRVYILPTRQGVLFAVALVMMLIGSINYNLSLGYVLTFMLAGLAVVSILHAFRNLAHLYVSGGRVEPVFAGETARFHLEIENRQRTSRKLRAHIFKLVTFRLRYGFAGQAYRAFLDPGIVSDGCQGLDRVSGFEDLRENAFGRGEVESLRELHFRRPRQLQ